MKQFQFTKYCSPAQLYLILSAIGLISAFLRNFRVMTLIFNAIFVVLFAWILNFLCNKGFGAISWVLVLLPFILMACTYFLALDAADQKDQEIMEGIENNNNEEENEEENEEALDYELEKNLGP